MGYNEERWKSEDWEDTKLDKTDFLANPFTRATLSDLRNKLIPAAMDRLAGAAKDCKDPDVISAYCRWAELKRFAEFLEGKRKDLG